MSWQLDDSWEWGVDLRSLKKRVERGLEMRKEGGNESRRWEEEEK